MPAVYEHHPMQKIHRTLPRCNHTSTHSLGAPASDWLGVRAGSTRFIEVFRALSFERAMD
jgi:hypothetical protein